MTDAKLLLALALTTALTGCVSVNPVATHPQQQFFDRLTAICGEAFAGELVSNDTADSDMAGKAMVMHVADCGPAQIRIPFHIETAPGTWDRSRTWIISKTTSGLRLKHDHRHEDGSADDITLYGGDTADSGSAGRQEFPVDAESIAMFHSGGLAASVVNIWAVEVDRLDQPDPQFAYELRRPGRHFRVEFELSHPVDAPPLPWGWE